MSEYDPYDWAAEGDFEESPDQDAIDWINILQHPSSVLYAETKSHVGPRIVLKHNDFQHVYSYASRDFAQTYSG